MDNIRLKINFRGGNASFKSNFDDKYRRVSAEMESRVRTQLADFNLSGSKKINQANVYQIIVGNKYIVLMFNSI